MTEAPLFEGPEKKFGLQEPFLKPCSTFLEKKPDLLTCFHRKKKQNLCEVSLLESSSVPGLSRNGTQSGLHLSVGSTFALVWFYLSVIGLEIVCHLLSHSKAGEKPVKFSSAKRQLYLFALLCDWFV